MARASDVMSSNVITVPQNATVEEAIRILLDHRISGAPVVDDEGNLVGIISEFRLLEVVYDPQVKYERVKDITTQEVLTVYEDTVLTEIASMFIVHRIRRLPVVRGKRLVGLIARSDLLRCSVSEAQVLRGGFNAALEHAQACG